MKGQMWLLHVVIRNGVGWNKADYLLWMTFGRSMIIPLHLERWLLGNVHRFLICVAWFCSLIRHVSAFIHISSSCGSHPHGSSPLSTLCAPQSSDAAAFHGILSSWPSARYELRGILPQVLRTPCKKCMLGMVMIQKKDADYLWSGSICRDLLSVLSRVTYMEDQHTVCCRLERMLVKMLG